MRDAEILFAEKGGAGIITLNRPKAFNALTLNMIGLMQARLDVWADDDAIERIVIRAARGRAFCAGGDVRVMYDWGRSGHPNALRFFRREYRLNTAVKRCSKPYIALLDGIVMGGGVGVSLHGALRIATENMTFAMPETGIGLFPDVGGTHFLPRCPGEIGMYLGLTGARLKAADALYAGLIDHFVPHDRLEELCAALLTGGDAADIAQDFAQTPGRAPLRDRHGDIDRIFCADSIEDIIARLEREGSDWAQSTRNDLAGKSPTSLKITFRQIREGAKLEFEDCMKLEFRLTSRILEAHDLYEGIRAVVIDKDMAPAWRPDTLDKVTPEMIDEYFAPLDRELEL